MRAPPHAPPQHVEIGLEPQRDRVLRDARARLVVQEGAPTGGDHLRAAGEQARHDAALAVAKIGLAVLLEDFRNRHAGCPLDLAIGVDEVEPEAPGEAAPGGALAASHQPDHDDRATRERRNEARRAPVARARGVILHRQGRACSHRQWSSIGHAVLKDLFGWPPVGWRPHPCPIERPARALLSASRISLRKRTRRKRTRSRNASMRRTFSQKSTFARSRRPSALRARIADMSG